MSNTTGVVECIDYASMSGPTELRVANSLKEAMGNTGFIFVRNHGLESQVKEMFEISERFFSDETMEEKRRIGYADNRGYTRVSQETLDPTKPELDMKEGFNLGYVSTSTPPKAVQPIPSLLEPDLPKLAKFEKDCFDFCESLLQAFAIILDLSLDFFKKEHTHDENTKAILRFLHYPKVAKGEKCSPNRVGAHSDYGSLTLLFQRSSGGEGLQILPSTEPLDSPNWQDVGIVEDALLVNIGDALELWSGAILKSTLHRVLLPPRNTEEEEVPERFSIAWFNQPRSDASLKTVAPVSDISANDLARMERKGVIAGTDVISAQHLQARLDSTYKTK